MPESITNRDDQHAVDVLTRYLEKESGPAGAPVFPSAHFDALGRDQGRDEPDRVTAEDLMAVNLLTAEVPPQAVVRLLGRDADRITLELARIPADLAIVDAPPQVLGGDSPASRLWRILRSGHDGVGGVLTSRILARKRPFLLPVWDAFVFQACGQDTRGHWLWLRDWLAADDALMWRWLADLAAQAPPEYRLSPLRLFDILVWMDVWDEHHAA